jgi:hypothetical protein
VSPSWQHRLKLAAIPSTVFAAVVFSLGWKSVSPFASWPLGLILLLSVPAVVPFALAAMELAGQQGGRRSRRAPAPLEVPPPEFRWRDVLTPRQAVVVGAVGVVVFVSFFMAWTSYRGSPETVNGELVFTDRGEVIGPATEREADEARTLTSRMFTGHLMLFGVLGLLASVPTLAVSPQTKRPASRARGPGSRPGGPRHRPTSTNGG